ncbi:hypothetical protein C8R47DRAFT_1079597 [Mycena vitilis]|nr:hypothetical protein C8R47DRAFT_1079597 [Mycena vitilis]
MWLCMFENKEKSLNFARMIENSLTSSTTATTALIQPHPPHTRMLSSSSFELEALVLSSADDIRAPGPITLSLASPPVDISPVAVLAPRKYAGPSNGVPSSMRVSTRRRLGSIPEEEVECKSPSPTSLTRMKAGQHGGMGLAAEMRRDAQRPKATSQPPTSPIPSPRTAAPLKSRLKATMQKLFNTRKFAKQTQLAIPEARAREGEKGAKMSSVMLLAAQSFLEEDRKFRKKERAYISEMPGSSTVRLSGQVLQVQEEQRRERKQARLEKLGAAPKKFVLMF